MSGPTIPATCATRNQAMIPHHTTRLIHPYVLPLSLVQLGDDAYITTSDTYALNISTDATATDAWYILGGTHYLYHFSCCGESDPTDLDNGGVVTVASAITYGLDAYWTWPCPGGTFSADGYEHSDALDAVDPTCEVDSGSCTIGTVNTNCPLAGYCPDTCTACPSGTYLEVATDSFNKHFQHMTQDMCSLCPVGKWQNGSTTPAAHNSLDDCVACPVGEYGDEVGATVCKVSSMI